MFSKNFRSKKQKCHNHPEKNAIGICASCKRPFCADCLIEVSDYYFCGSESCKNIVKQAQHSAIASCAGDLAEHVLGFIDGGTKGIRESQEEDINALKVAAIYNEIVFLSLHNLMDTISKNLPDEESDIFFGVLYGKIRDILTIDYSDNIDAKEFQAYFDGTFKERREEYYQFPNLIPESFSDDPLYMSFGKKISKIFDKELDLENDAIIQSLYVLAFTTIQLANVALETIKEETDF